MELTLRPDGLYRLMIGDLDTFPVYAVSGGLYSRPIAYLIRKGSDDWLPCTDMGKPHSDEPFSIRDLGHDAKYVTFWVDGPESVEAAARALLNA